MELQATECTDGTIIMLPGKVGGSKAEAEAMSAMPVSSASAAAAMSPATPTSHATSPMMPRFTPDASTPNACISDAVRAVLNLSFPRCSCCKTEWYGATECSDNDNDNSDKMEVCKAIAGKRKRERPSHYTLFPMPKCSCITRLALPHLPHDIFTEEGFDNPVNVLSQIKTHAFPNLAICKSCLRHRIDASKEVTVHDYRQEHITNGQRNVRFTVEPDCVQCKRKFRGRELEKLLESEAGPKFNSNAGGGRRKKGKADANWWEALEATIRLVGWAKRENNRERKSLRRQRRDGKANLNGKTGETERTAGWWENCKGFTGGDDNCSSDECYSLSSNSIDEWESTDDASRPTKGPHRVALKSGELAEELMQKDPKFRQEKEDEQYVQQYMEEMQEEEKKQKEAEAKADEEYAKRFMQEEEERQKAEADARARKDHEMAMKLQEELKKDSSKFTPAKTRSKKNPIAAAWNKQASAEKPARKRHPNEELSPKSKKPKHASDDLDHDRSSPSAHSPGEASVTSSKTPAHTAGPEPDRLKPPEIRKNLSTTQTPIELLDDSSDDTSDCDESVKSPCKDSGSEPKNCKQPEEEPESKASASAAKSQINDAYDDSSDDDDDGIYEIVSMGFRKDSARRCLKDANGNVEMAVSMLLSEAAEADS